MGGPSSIITYLNTYCDMIVSVQNIGSPSSHTKSSSGQKKLEIILTEESEYLELCIRVIRSCSSV